MKLIYDCDNTIGIHGKDVDDGLTLLYLYQQTNVELLGVTLTFGNGTVEQVVQQTDNLKKLFSLNVETYRGKEKYDSQKEHSPAAEFLAKSVRDAPNEITILATGSLNNLSEAAEIEPKFFDLVKEIVVMGGRFGQMYINKTAVTELNFSISDKAAHKVVNSNAKLIVSSGQYIAGALFSYDDLDTIKDSTEEKFVWLKKVIKDWIDYTKGIWDVDGFINWDGITAFALLNPEEFVFKDTRLRTSAADMETGLIEETDLPDKRPAKVLTEIKDLAKLNSMLVETLNKY
ncbi:nucleoside hydrolase, IUNH family protein [Companilactobacillus tucceti DSM 20183]|uniref:Nucleoside hydrolase, IUNH family protein n=1 Tax=Companilactobacillus tucceti DSM 20183 TaxID=1423811 RepID=A0A0R1J4V8_9LACO|nr:nucleoside hydrolase [Companilactobacillus tucceti]KRK63843.1 nucleoside hydrolase, IUNH family protein [Companilactobacillus tucceti DSM 20183]